jgi:squalene synthase HpnC
MLCLSELAIARRLPMPGCSRDEAERYTRWLAKSHYENFHVTTWLLPRRLRQHFCNVYAFCRWADDLADEIHDPRRSLDLLQSWEEELTLCYRGSASHPVLIALAETVRRFDLPSDPFLDLLKAFRQDQTVFRYPDWTALTKYCRHSANPVGRLVLYLGGYRDADRQRLSDATCTALQLTNFWQDVGRDLEKGRIYVPMDAMAAHAVEESDLRERRFDRRYAGMMQDLVERTRQLFIQGWPLVQQVDRRLRVDLELFTRGGLAVLAAIERSGYDTLRSRPSIGSGTRLKLLAQSVCRPRLTDFPGGGTAASADTHA